MKYLRAREHVTEQEARSCFLNCTKTVSLLRGVLDKGTANCSCVVLVQHAAMWAPAKHSLRNGHSVSTETCQYAGHVLKDSFSLKGSPGQKGEKGNSVYVSHFGKGPPVSI